MISDKAIRTTLWFSMGLNLLSAYGLAFPTTYLAAQSQIPTGAPPLYSFMLAYSTAALGLAFAWAAMQKPINAAVVGIGALGKIGLFVVIFLLWGANQLETATVIYGLLELILGVVWLMWLLDDSRKSPKS